MRDAKKLVPLLLMSHFCQNSIISLLLLACTAVLAPIAAAESTTKDHPTVALVNEYFRHVVDEDWKAAAAMLNPASLERKKRKAVELVRRAPTMSAEAEVLAQLGAKDVRELENMTNEEFYAAERSGVSKRDTKGDTIRKQKQDSLKVTVLGIILEQKDTIAHLAVRTSQDVLEKRIDELIFISFAQDQADKKKWYIVPDMQLPVTSPIPVPTEAAPASKPEPKEEPKTAPKGAGKVSKK